jgi:hypothetical protein
MRGLRAGTIKEKMRLAMRGPSSSARLRMTRASFSFITQPGERVDRQVRV